MKMLKGYRKKGQRIDPRLPITLPILHKLIDSTESFSCPNFTKVQFSAMCSLAFYAFLRVGEMTAPTQGACPPVQLSQLTPLVDSTGKIMSLKLTFMITNTIIISPFSPLSSTASHLIAQLSQSYFT